MARLVLEGDVRARLRELPDESVHCVVTSPPYWALRDYGVEGQLGLEATPQEYVHALVEVFRDVRRVLRGDGVVWLNLGDSYAGSWGAQSRDYPDDRHKSGNQQRAHPKRTHTGSIPAESNLKPKDLVGMPWRVALALQDDGWWLRCDVIWSKGNPMPESVGDRPTRSHEYVFFLTKSASYYFDQDAVREQHADPRPSKNRRAGKNAMRGQAEIRPRGNVSSDERYYHPGGRNLRSVWNIATRPFPGAHSATFPPELPERCIRAGTSERGSCAACGAPWLRITEKTATGRVRTDGSPRHVPGLGRVQREPWQEGVVHLTVGWRASCTCEDARDPVPCVVLDPFAGSFTTCEVAARMGRDWIGIEINPGYVRMGRRRLAPFMRPLSTFGGGLPARDETEGAGKARDAEEHGDGAEVAGWSCAIEPGDEAVCGDDGERAAAGGDGSEDAREGHVILFEEGGLSNASHALDARRITRETTPISGGSCGTTAAGGPS